MDDLKVRDEALNLDESFIVQAPAGSGKTELLTQRYLGLLTRVKSPEQVLAITFTRKAAEEMLERVLETLNDVARGNEGEPHRAKAYAFAKQVLALDEELQWDLLLQPHRLQIKTIDSLCQWVVRQMPVSAQCSLQPSITTDKKIYTQSARTAVVELLRMKNPAIMLLLSRVGGKAARIITLIAGMLSQRSHWLNYQHLLASDDANFVAENQSAVFQQVLLNIVVQMDDFITADQQATLFRIYDFSRQFVGEDNVELSADLDYVERWRRLIRWMLTGKGLVRSRLSKNNGIPADLPKSDERASLCTEFKEQFTVISADLNDNEQLLTLAELLNKAPGKAELDSAWPTVHAINSVFKYSLAHLMADFSEQQTLDFIEVSQRANQALGDEGNPSDLTLRLDYQFNHILVDEFQDTSYSQISLLKKLIGGWVPGDGRTLFFVGDPMQSIYRFRQAEVGLFLDVQQRGLGQIPVKPLLLTSNFRSSQTIVEWVNKVFSDVFPAQDNVSDGAVKYAVANVTKPAKPTDKVAMHAFESPVEEAEHIVSTIDSMIQDRPEFTVAILVRSRSALKPIVAELTKNNIAFEATDIDPLNSRPHIVDLLILTRACLQWEDRIAWFSLMRAPFCGVDAKDLYTIAQFTKGRHFLSELFDESLIERLSDQGKQRVTHLVNAMQLVLSAQFMNFSLRDKIMLLWTRLQGSVFYQGSSVQSDIDEFLKLVDELSSHGDLVDIGALTEKLETLYAASQNAQVKLMTIHKSKGLQFDAVFLPALNKLPGSGDQQLLNWHEFVDDHADAHLLLAPLADYMETNAQFVSFINKLDSHKEQYELSRVLYVAATRAKSQLYLTASVVRKKGSVSIKANSSLRTLYKSKEFSSFYEANAPDYVEDSEAQQVKTKVESVRLQNVESSTVDHIALSSLRPSVTSAKHPQWASFNLESDAREIGIVVHRVLHYLALNQLVKVADLTRLITRWLRAEGVNDSLATHTAQIIEWAAAVKRDQRGAWILSSGKPENYEYAVQGLVGDKLLTGIIDCTFIVDQTRWIIDYKTSEPGKRALDAFYIDQQQKYAKQLANYAQLIGQEEGVIQVKHALYFPKFCGWHEWTVS